MRFRAGRPVARLTRAGLIGAMIAMSVGAPSVPPIRSGHPSGATDDAWVGDGAFWRARIGAAVAGAETKGRPAAAGGLRQQERALDEVRRQLDDARARASVARSREASLLAELEQLDGAVADKRREVARLDRRIATIEAELTRLLGERGQVAEETVALAGRIVRYLVTLERVRHQPDTPAWLAGEATVAHRRAVNDLATVVRQDLEQLEQFEGVAERLSTREAATQIRRRQLSLLRELLLTERRQLHEQLERRRALLLEARDDRATHDRLVQELGVASQRLEALVRQLAEQARLREEARQRAEARRRTASAGLPTSRPDLRPGSPAVGLGRFRGRLPWPIEGRVILGFGPQVHPRFGTETMRHGIDIEAEHGAVIRAVFPGVVAYRGQLRGYGNLMVLDHGEGYYTLYAHASEFLVADGERVEAGQGIARAGDTGAVGGPRLYFEVRYQGRAENPEAWLRRRS